METLSEIGAQSNPSTPESWGNKLSIWTSFTFDSLLFLPRRLVKSYMPKKKEEEDYQ